MDKTLTRDQFPVIYDHGKPQAVVVDVETFDFLVQTATQLQQLADDPQEVEWIAQVVERARARWEAHPEDVMTFETPQAALDFLDEPEPA
jgi:PHD/YefM family antitoxin component YafN of YafNO toxin-antitoxin module